MDRKRIILITEIALMAALAMLLDWIIPSTHGLKITVKMIPIIVLALRRGVVPGMIGGLLWGLLQIVTGEAYILTPIQTFVEYILAFTVIGLAGVFSSKVQQKLEEKPIKKNQIYQLAAMGTVFASLIRYFWHFVAGIVFWGEYAPEGVSAAMNSLLVNGGAFLSETITCLVALGLLIPFYEQLLDPRKLA